MKRSATRQLELDFQRPQEGCSPPADELDNYIRAVEANGRQNRQRIKDKGAPAGREDNSAGAFAHAPGGG